MTVINQQVDGNTEVNIHLSINTWNSVFSLIVKGPWEQADPLLREMHKQIKEQLEGQAVPANGSMEIDHGLGKR